MLTTKPPENNVSSDDHHGDQVVHDPPRFTICTPTFNRAHTLHRVYDSLTHQLCQDFEWLIIDDESTDNTADVVESLRKTAPFVIRYLQQDHGHKKKAVNYGAKEARGELFLVWDSDDSAPVTALEDLLAAWQEIPSDQRARFAGVWGNCASPEGTLIGGKYPLDIFDSDYGTVQYCHGIRGEKWGFTRTTLMQIYPYPESVVGFVPEGTVWSRIGLDYKTRYINKIVRFYYDESDSLTRTRSVSQNNSPGLALWSGEVLGRQLKYFWNAPIVFFRAASNLTRFRLHSSTKNKEFELQRLSVQAMFLVIIFSPVGLLAYCVDCAANGMKKLRL